LIDRETIGDQVSLDLRRAVRQRPTRLCYSAAVETHGQASACPGEIEKAGRQRRITGEQSL
jgi:hypothetical protein